MAHSKLLVKKTAGRKSAGKTTRTKAGETKAGDFGAVFRALRELLEPYEGPLALRSPNDSYSFLESHEPTYRNRPMFFAAVRAGKGYVSYHLMPVAGSRVLQEGLSPELKRRKQGKACFNFSEVDRPLFDELAKLTEAGYQEFKRLKYL